MALSKKHRAFVEQYLRCFNATEAYERVYNPQSRASAATAGHRLLRNVEIEDAIKKRLQEKAMSADEVLMRLADQARADLGLYMSDDGEINIAAMKEDGKTHLIHTVERHENTGISDKGVEWQNVRVKVKTHDAQSALQLLGKHHKLFTDKVEHEHSGNIGFSADDYAQADNELDEWTNNEQKSNG